MRIDTEDTPLAIDQKQEGKDYKHLQYIHCELEDSDYESINIEKPREDEEIIREQVVKNSFDEVSIKVNFSLKDSVIEKLKNYVKHIKNLHHYEDNLKNVTVIRSKELSFQGRNTIESKIKYVQNKIKELKDKYNIEDIIKEGKNNIKKSIDNIVHLHNNSIVKGCLFRYTSDITEPEKWKSREKTKDENVEKLITDIEELCNKIQSLRDKIKKKKEKRKQKYIKLLEEKVRVWDENDAMPDQVLKEMETKIENGEVFTEKGRIPESDDFS